MLQDQNGGCPFTRMRINFHEKMAKIEDVDSLVNYGLLIMLVLVTVFSWLS